MNYDINTKRVLSLLLVTTMVLSTGVIAANVGNEQSPTENTWIKQGMVLDGAGFGLGATYPFMLHHEGIYKMWYTIYYSSLDQEIYYATSPDGVNWTEQGCVLPKLPGTEYVVAPSVIIEENGTYKMWFTCHDGPWRSRTYLAISNDGINWSNQGLVLDIGPPGSPDSTYAVQGKVFKDEGLYKMYYKSYSDSGGSYFMYATSVDGYSWDKHGVVMNLLPGYTGMQCPYVVKNSDGKYTMWYDAGDASGHKIHLANSTDGLSWTEGGVDLDVGAPGAPDDAGVFCPFVVNDPVTGNELMYYVGSDGSKYRIFLAQREGVGGNTTVDLSIFDGDITLSDGSPSEGDPVTITAVVHGDQSTGLGAWEKSGVVVDIGGAGEDRHVYTPSVLQLPNGTYVMYYTATDIAGYDNLRIYKAFSFDGLVWHKEGMVLDRGGLYEEVGVCYPYVLIDENGTFQMWYTGISYNNGYRFNIHRASSSDGFIWQKNGPDLTYGSQADPDGAATPYVLYDGSMWYMWYMGIDWSPHENRICAAHKLSLSDPWIKDGIVLNNDGPNDAPIAGYPWVLPTGNGYEMYYSGMDDQGTVRILHATSQDGLSWDKTGIVIEPTLPLEGNNIGKPSIQNTNEKIRMWYHGYDGTNIRIFYAEKAPVEPGLDATCTVSFYLDSIAEGNLIDRQFNVFVPADGQTTVSTDWTAVAGDHSIIVEVSEVDPTDSDLSNNVASKVIFVENPATATATGPQGAHHDPIITLTYEWTGTPTEVDLYYSTNAGDSWNYLGTDTTIDGSYDWTPEANPGPKPSKYYWIANAQNGADDVGIPADGTPPEAGPFNWKTWDVCTNAPRPLSGNGDDWFFISVPLDISGDLFTIFDDANWGDGGTTWDYIQWYDTNDPSDPWKSYSIYRPQALNDDTIVDNTMGFWIHLTSNDGDGVLTVGEGTEISSTVIQLNAGWNLVGYPTLNEATIVADALWGTGADIIEAFDPTAPYKLKAVGPTYIMMPGEAYWIHVPADTTWTIDW